MRLPPVSRLAIWMLLLLPLSTTCAQQYDDGGYQDDQGGGPDDYYSQDQDQDNLYHNYAMRQQQKEEKAAGTQGIAWGSLAGGAVVGWLAGGKFHSGRLQKKLNAKHKEDQKALYKQYYNDVYALQEQNQQLISALEQYGVRVK